MKRHIFSRLLAFILAANLSLAIVPLANAATSITIEPQANGATSISASDVVATANNLVGKYPHYVWGGYSPANGGFDCTGLIYYVYHTCLGYNMTLTQARSKSQILGLGTKITDKSALLPGDIVQYTISHVGIYIGNNTVIHSGTTYGVSKVSINSPALTFSYGIRLANVDQSGSTGVVPGITAQYFSCNVNIACFAGQTVNLYNNPGDSNRAAYFSRGQNVSSTYGATLSDGSTWYRVSVTDQGIAKTLWLKYESSKMTVTTVNPTYTVTFNPNGGNISRNSQTVTSGSAYGSLPEATRNGYTFDGWYTSASGGSVVTSGTIFNGSSNITLYAHWTQIPPTPMITITFDANGGSVSPGYKQITPGSYLSGMPAAVRSGYTFLGWTLDRIDPNAPGTQVAVIINDNVFSFDEDTTLYAYWKSETPPPGGSYKVYFDANGGTVSPSYITVAYGARYGTLPTPTRDGYTFDDWYADRNCTVRITSNTLHDKYSDITLYARWKEIPSAACSHAKGSLLFTKEEHPHYNYYLCSKCGELFTDYSTTPDTSCERCWGPWSGWSTTPVYPSSTRQVETRSVQISAGATEYRYGRYIDSTGGHICWCATYLGSKGYSGITVQYSGWSTNRYAANGKVWTCGYCNGNHTGIHHYDSSGRPCWNEYSLSSGSYYWEESRQTSASYETQYRYRDLISG